jgi:hypothetical protein
LVIKEASLICEQYKQVLFRKDELDKSKELPVDSIKLVF